MYHQRVLYTDGHFMRRTHTRYSIDGFKPRKSRTTYRRRTDGLCAILDPKDPAQIHLFLHLGPSFGRRFSPVFVNIRRKVCFCPSYTRLEKMCCLPNKWTHNNGTGMCRWAVRTWQGIHGVNFRSNDRKTRRIKPDGNGHGIDSAPSSVPAFSSCKLNKGNKVNEKLYCAGLVQLAYRAYTTGRCK